MADTTLISDLGEELGEEHELLDPDPAQPSQTTEAEAREEETRELSLLPLSGLYTRQTSLLPIPTVPGKRLIGEELRLDVDGHYPQMTASGVVAGNLVARAHWIAHVQRVGLNTYSGPIWYKSGSAAFPYTEVKIRVVGSSLLPSLRKAIATFSAPGVKRSFTYRFRSGAFHRVEFEFDAEQGITPVTAIGTHDHPNHPATLPNQTLSIQKVYRRTGFEVTTSPGASVVLPAGAGSNAQWSDAEMHDAMQTYWSRFANKPQWALWVFFASQHELGSGLGGVMFDDIGPNHRQGTALFYNSFISQAPAGDPAPTAWVNRMKFWTVCHEMGHAFNLAHSWQKALGTPWIPLTNDAEARSFMNYPYRVLGGQTAFFSDFQYRFSDQELLFLRHAPERFVQMGNADWFDHHGFEQARVTAESKLKLELRVNRARAEFEFLECPMLEAKLTNVSTEPILISARALAAGEELTVVMKRDGRPARSFVPFARQCWQPRLQVLAPGESLYEPLFVAAGQGGWNLAEPGYYTVQAALHLDEEDVVSNPLRVRIAPPKKQYEEEYLAQDFFSDEVGRALTFDGTRALDKANDTLHEVTKQLPTRRAAIHAQVALAMPLTADFKELVLGPSGKAVKVQPARPALAEKDLAVLTHKPDDAAETLGHIEYRYYTERLADVLARDGKTERAVEALGRLKDTLEERKVLPRVVAEVATKQASYAKGGRGVPA